MSGAGIRLFTAGSPLLASQINNYLMDQVIAYFADSDARDEAFGSIGEPELAPGRVCYLFSDNKLYLYSNANEWVEIGAQIDDLEVTTAKLADGAVTNAKLGTITTAGKIANSATTATEANTASAIVSRDASGNFIAGKATLATADVTTVVETATIVAAASTGTINIEFSTNPTVYYTSNATANWTLNVRGTSGATLNSILTTGQIATVTFLATNGGTPYRPTVFQVDGSAVTPKWMGGAAPTTGNANSIDAYTLAIIKTGSAAFTMLASQSKFA
jgi:hypothetical protein